MNQQAIRHYVDDAFTKAEVVIYLILGLMLALTAFLALTSASIPIWQGLRHLSIATETLQILDHLLVVLMLVEIFHTVRISIRSHILVTEPFLIVGLIATVRRILMITLEFAAYTNGPSWTGETAREVFRESMVELGLLGGLVLVFVFSICFLRRFPESNASGEATPKISHSNGGRGASTV
jgi:uncharacterized membrane protein (DUF373 family)